MWCVLVKWTDRCPQWGQRWSSFTRHNTQKCWKVCSMSMCDESDGDVGLCLDLLVGQKTAVEQLKERFDKMKLSYDAYRCAYLFLIVAGRMTMMMLFSLIEYVGTQTASGQQTDFSNLRATITSTLDNNKIRSPRRLSVIFRALKVILRLSITCVRSCLRRGVSGAENYSYSFL